MSDTDSRKAAFFDGVPQKKERQDQPIKMRFGKYKGNLLEDVIEFDPEYAKWLYELDNAKEFKKSYAILHQKFGQASSIEVLPR